MLTPVSTPCTLGLGINRPVSFVGYHYQMKMHVFDRKHSENADPTFFVKLYGSHNDTGNMPVEM